MELVRVNTNHNNVFLQGVQDQRNIIYVISSPLLKVIDYFLCYLLLPLSNELVGYMNVYHMYKLAYEYIGQLLSVCDISIY